MSSNQPTEKQIDWCREQQAAALEHLKPGHTCDHPQCRPDNNRQWLTDAFTEELLIEGSK